MVGRACCAAALLAEQTASNATIETLFLNREDISAAKPDFMFFLLHDWTSADHEIK